jgi:uncharacterized protein
MLRGLVFVIGFVVILPCPVEAASFDCRKATTNVEKLICSSPELRISDIQLYEVYMRAIRQAAKPNQVLAKQRQWLTDIRNKCKTTENLALVYQERIKQLESGISFKTCEAEDLRYCNAEIKDDEEKTISDLIKLFSSRMSSSEIAQFNEIQNGWRKNVECSCEYETNEENGPGTGWSGYFVSCEKKEIELRINEIREILAGKVGPMYGGGNPASCDVVKQKQISDQEKTQKDL